MKKILNIMFGFALLAGMQSCDPMKDVYAELDEGAIDQSGVKELELELTKTEYDLLKGVDKASTPYSYQYFNSEDSAKVLIPVILKKKYLYLGEGSSANVTYNLGNKNLTLNQNFTVYTMQAADYTAIGLSYPNLSSLEQIKMAAGQVKQEAEQGDVLKLTYTWYPGKNPTVDSIQNIVYLDNEWQPAYTLSNADYTTMQQSYTNFTSRTTVESYLPVFLKNKFPYILTEGYVLPVVYVLRQSNVNSFATSILTFMNGAWTVNDGTNSASMKFSFTKGAWQPDNTIRYTLTTDDHKLIVSKYVVGNDDAKANIASYGNFDLNRFTDRSVIVKALSGFAKEKFPESAVGQRYLLTYATYNPRGTGTLWIELGENGEYAEIKE